MRAKKKIVRVTYLCPFDLSYATWSNMKGSTMHNHDHHDKLTNKIWRINIKSTKGKKKLSMESTWSKIWRLWKLQGTRFLVSLPLLHVQHETMQGSTKHRHNHDNHNEKKTHKKETQLDMTLTSITRREDIKRMM
jgi:hypothetical protein